MPTRDAAAREPRTLVLDGGTLDYTLVRRRGRRGIGLVVDSTGLTVNAALSVTLPRIERTLRDSESWVRRKLELWHRRQVPVQGWEEGASLLYLGETLTLRPFAGKRTNVERAGDELRVCTPVASDDCVRRAVVAWYRKAALAHFAHRAFVFSRLAGLTPPRVMLSSARWRWGSCNSRREIRLSWRLVKAPPALVDYVVCHELAHLRHMNHSREFWSVVQELCPDYRRLRDELQAHDHLYRSF